MSSGKCDRCEKPATVLVTEISGGKRVEKHLCENCAGAADGTEIAEMLLRFVKRRIRHEHG